jgi:hypothetical protein
MKPFLTAGGRLGAVAILLLAACSPSDIIEVDNPDIIPPEDVLTPQGLAALHAGAIGDFSLAFVGNNGGTEGLVLVSGSMSDELGNSETFPTRKEYDQRSIDERNGTLDAVFRNVHVARAAAERAAAALKEFGEDPATDPRIAEMHSLAGFVYLMLAENYCSGVPASTADNSGELTFGEPLSTEELVARAIEQADSAALYPADETATNLAALLRGRALLYGGDPAAAAAAVAAVPTDFEYVTTHTTALGRQQNGVFVFINQNERFSVANLDGGNGLPFRDALDPRVPWARTPGTDVGFDNATPQFDQGKYANETAPVVVAGGVEARLIEAEAALAAGDVAGWLGILNALRADPSLLPGALPANFPPLDFGPLTPLTDPGSPAARVDLMFGERAFWLYLTAHRLADLRRLVTQYGRAPEAVYPGGGGAPYVIDGNPKGGNFGSDLVLPVPFSETNNPQFQGCLDEGA